MSSRVLCATSFGTLLGIVVLLPSAHAADPGLVDLLPAGGKVIFGVKLAQARATPFGEYLISEMAEKEKDLAELAAVTGFDPRRDLVEVIGTSQTAKGPHTGFIAVRGTFDADRIAAAATARGANVVPYRGVKIIGGENERGTVAFLNATLAIAGQVEEVTAGIDRWLASERAPPEVAARLAEISSGQDVWALSLGSPTELADRVTDSTLKGAMKGEIMQSIQEMRGGIKFGEQVKLSGQTVTRSNDDAVALAGVVRFFVSLAELNNRGKYAGLAKALGSNLQLSTEANRVIFSLSMPEQEFEKLLESLQQPSRAVAPIKDNALAENHSSRN